MKIITLLIPIVFISACTLCGQSFESRTNEMSASTEKTQQEPIDKIRLVKEKFSKALWNERKFEVADTLFTDDFYTESMALQESNWVQMHGKGAASMVHHIKWWLEILPDAQLRIIDIIAHQDTVIETWELSGTMEGELLGQQPTFEPVKIYGCTVAIFENGKIRKHKTLLDKFGLMQQIGAL